MSKSSKHGLASKASQHSASRMLNAEAPLFTPSFTQASFSRFQCSSLRATAPAFVASTARQNTPHCAFDNNVVNAAPLNSHPHDTASGSSWTAAECFDAPINFSISNSIDFDTSSLNTSGITPSGLYSSGLKNSSGLDSTSLLGNTPAHYTSGIECSGFDNISGLDTTRGLNNTPHHNAYGHGSFYTPKNLQTSYNKAMAEPNSFNPPIYNLGTATEKDSDYSSPGLYERNQDKSKDKHVALLPSHQSSVESAMNSTEGVTTVYDSELDGEGETDDEYEPPVSSSSANVDCATAHYPTPNSDDSSSEQADAGMSLRLRTPPKNDKCKNAAATVKSGRVQKGKPSALSTLGTYLKELLASEPICDDNPSNGDTSDGDASGDDTSDDDASDDATSDEDTPDEDTSDKDVCEGNTCGEDSGEDTAGIAKGEEMLEDLFSHFAKEKKKANATIKEQKARLTLAQRLGQAIRIISTLGRVKVEGVYWFAPKNDLSIPSCEQAKLACVQNVVAAMRNYENIKDKKTKGVKNRWGDGASYYSREELYACAGDIVDFMVDVHTNGWKKTTYDAKIRQAWQQTMYSTFEERFTTLILLLKRSKRTCDDILKGERFYTVIGNPWEIDGRSTSNSKSNTNKGEELKKLTAAKRKRAAEEQDDAAEVSSARRPRKQLKTTK